MTAMSEWRHDRQAGLALRRAQRLLDVDWYARQTGEVFTDADTAWLHYRSVGAHQRASPHPLFDSVYYTSVYPDVASLQDPFEHFVATGDGELRRPHGLFDPEFFLAHHDLAQCSADVETPWQHFLECGDQSIPATPLWSPVLDGAEEPASSGRRLFLESLKGPVTGLRTPHPAFDPTFVRQQMPVSEWESPELPWYASRLGDARVGVDPNPMFDQGFYQHVHHELPWHDSPLAHWLKAGGRGQAHPGLPTQVLEFLEQDGRDALSSAMLEQRWADTVLTGNEIPFDVDALVIDIDACGPTIASCVLALRDAARAGTSLRVWIADNASSSERESEVLRLYLPAAQIIRLSQRRSYGETNNLLAELGSAETILLLNNDAYMPAGSLAPLMKTLSRDEDAVAAGPAFIYPDGSIQEVGGRITDDGLPIQLAKYFRQIPEHMQCVREVDYVSAACLLVTRPAYESVGGFDFRFEPAYFEDTDLCLRLKDCGHVLVDPSVPVIHLEGFTTSREDVLPDKLQAQQLARERFLATHAPGGVRPHPYAGKPVLAQVKERQRPKAAFYSPYGLMTGGGERYLLGMAESVAETHDVRLMFDGPYSQMRLRNIQQALGLPLRAFHIVEFRQGVADVDLWVVMANSLAPPVEARGRMNVYHCQFPFDAASDFAVDAPARINGYDVVIVNSEFTRSHYLRKAARWGLQPTVLVVNPPCDVPEPQTALPERRDPNILSVGRFFVAGHSKRQDIAVAALKALLDDVPDAHLSLIGGVGGQADAQAYFARVLAMAEELPVAISPDVSRDALQAGYQQSRVYWQLTGFGSTQAQPEVMEHFGISIVEAMGHGAVPVCYRGGGPVEILSQIDERLLVSSVEDLLRVTRWLLANDESWQSLSESARRHAQRYRTAAFSQAFREVVTACSDSTS
jgi:glycosyltransferase involved in cell wall biosynthesis